MDESTQVLTDDGEVAILPDPKNSIEHEDDGRVEVIDHGDGD